ncbi:hypothetical protein CLOM_g17545 [Closterium sp. NIES-68]|nr:hypothetical protein CLOM_g17545 [Closterium sp. NIES-68]
MGVRPAAAVVQQQVRVDPVGVQLPGQRAADTAYTKYSWKPRACTIRRFDRAYFKATLRNKVVAFVGDSFSRNLQQAIACELAWTTASSPGPAG